MQYPTRRMDLSRYIFEYLTSDVIDKTDRLKFEVINKAKPLVKMIRPIEISILFDNLVSNAEKAKARQMSFKMESEGTSLKIRVANDGEKVPKVMQDQLFSLGISGRGGSGIGLYTCKEIVNSMDGEISFDGNDAALGGAAFTIIFHS